MTAGIGFLMLWKEGLGGQDFQAAFFLNVKYIPYLKSQQEVHVGRPRFNFALSCYLPPKYSEATKQQEVKL